MIQSKKIFYEEKDEGTCRQHFSLWIKVALCSPWMEVRHLGRRMILNKNQTMLGKGENIDGIYFLERGVLRLTSQDINGNEAILLYITDKNLFGDSSYFNNMPVYVGFSAVEDCTIYYFSRSILEREIFPKDILYKNNLLEYMAYKVGVLLHHQCELLSQDVLGKVCRIILDIAQYDNFNESIHSKITQKEMATALGLHRATFSKAISELKNTGVLEWVTKQEIIIKDYEKLQEHIGDVFAL